MITLSYKGLSEDLVSALQKDPVQHESSKDRVELDWLGERAHFRLFIDRLGEKTFYTNCNDKIQVLVIYKPEFDQFFVESTKKK